jgi:hypothetical protein
MLYVKLEQRLRDRHIDMDRSPTPTCTFNKRFTDKPVTIPMILFILGLRQRNSLAHKTS